MSGSHSSNQERFGRDPIATPSLTYARITSAPVFPISNPFHPIRTITRDWCFPGFFIPTYSTQTVLEKGTLLIHRGCCMVMHEEARADLITFYHAVDVLHERKRGCEANVSQHNEEGVADYGGVPEVDCRLPLIFASIRTEMGGEAAQGSAMPHSLSKPHYS